MFEGAFTKLGESESMNREIPGTFGVQYKLVLAGLCAGTVRSTIETPFEYVKVKKQTMSNWVFKDIYTGYFVLWPRTVGLVSIFFVTIDCFRRKTNWMDHKLGQFCAAGLGAVIGLWVTWPLELIKNQI